VNSIAIGADPAQPGVPFRDNLLYIIAALATKIHRGSITPLAVLRHVLVKDFFYP
jgi:hypothetical protein